jgi:hypothetical protein
MRALILAFVLGLALATSAQAAPLAPKPAGMELPSLPPIQLVRDGCGRGWHRSRWRDQWGYRRWGHCIPNGGPHDAWSAGWNHPQSDWRGPSGGRGNPSRPTLSMPVSGIWAK